MPKEIIWSRMAEIDLTNVTEYLIHKWSPKIANNFLDLVEEYSTQISYDPQSYPMINKKLKVRKCVVTKHNSLYYQELDNRIEIIRLFDNRQDPKKLKF